MGSVYFFNEGVNFSFKNKDAIRSWLCSAVTDHQKQLVSLNYIFTSDDLLADLNNQYLRHNTYTDILTFDQSTEEEAIEGEIYISIDRVSDNAKALKTDFEDELHRVCIHGVLHLLGYGDKTPGEKNEMRKKENHYLDLRPQIMIK
jgi:probable rRNA maturation factor